MIYILTRVIFISYLSINNPTDKIQQVFKNFVKKLKKKYSLPKYHR